MTTLNTGAWRAGLMAACASCALLVAGAAQAQTAPAPNDEVVVTVSKTTRSSVTIAATEIQKILPGVSPLKAIETLPGVLYETADPWGNNEQNESLFVHGFSTQQLGYTMDNVPLGDQQYGNYNGLSVSRAVTSENVNSVVLSSGAGVLGVASTSNLGGAIETFSSDPSKTRGFDIRETVGSYSTTRTFVRVDSGTFGGLGGDNAGYISYLHHDARAWDFNGHQRDDQVNAKFVHDDAHGKLTLFADWDDKVEPNEDSTAFGNQQTAAAANYTPYTRPFIYPNLAACTTYLTNGSPPAAAGNNFTNCFSAAQRTDILLYAKYDYKITPDITWSNQGYYHYDYGRGIVAGPINQAGLPTLFAAYFPSLIVGGSATSAGSLANLVKLFGGTGNEVRTTEYRINRYGELSTLDWNLGDHKIEAGLWYEHNDPAQHRVWYPFSAANNDLTPYDVPKGPHVFTQYYFQFHVDDVQLHLQDQWRILPTLLLQAGFKSSLQTINDSVPIQQVNILPGNPSGLAPTSPAVTYPTGSLTSNNWFLPQVGAVWDVTGAEQMFANIQENMRQFIPYGAGGNFYGTSPYGLGTQAAFDLFKSTVKPETSWTYEVGLRTHHSLDLGFVTGFEGQASYYHVDFSNRLFNVAPYSFINPAPSIIVNVGGVTTDGVDIAGTLHFGPHFQIYDAVSYNRSTYNNNYSSGITNGVPVIVPIAGKSVPLTPDWLEKFIASTNWGPFEAQINGDYIGRRYVTYLNDIALPTQIQFGLEASYRFDAPVTWLQGAKISANVTNLTDIKGVSTANVTGASGGYTAYPIAPRMAYVTLAAKF
jgi:hypothetical protein